MKCFVLFLLVGLSWGQTFTSDDMSMSITSSDDMAMPSTSTMPSPTSTSMPTDVSTTPTSTVLSTGVIPIVTPPPDITAMEYSATRRYRNATFYAAVYGTTYDMTRSFRLARFNCHERNAKGVITNRVPSARVFTMYLHMPVIHFLTENYKKALMTSISGAFGISVSNICIDGHDQAFVSEFEEGVMLRIYDSTVEVVDRHSGEQLQNEFNKADRSTKYFQSFLGMLGFNYSSSRAALILKTYVGRVSINIGGCRQLDPMYNMYNGRNLTTAELMCTTLSSEQRNEIKEDVPENPDPVNYYLEAGDIVFAVIGAILISIILALVLLGYFIHPVFLS